MNKKLYKTLKKNNCIHKFKHPSGSHFISCKCCENKELRAYASNGFAMLCYECSTLFWTFSGEIITKLKGNPETWHKKTIEIMNELDKEKYNNTDKYDQFISALKKRLIRQGQDEPKVINNISGEELVENYRVCTDCGEEFFTLEEFDQILEKSESFQETLDNLEKLSDTHSINKYISETDYEKINYGEDTWRHEGLFISPEIREYITKEIAKEYKEWIGENFLLSINHSEDSEFDCSGRIEMEPTVPVVKLKMFKTLSEWWEDTLTGGSYKSYESGCGIFHERYSELIEELVMDKLHEIWMKKPENEKDITDDILFEQTEELMKFIGKMSTVEAYLI